jgi:hypothetical protein
MDLQDGTYRARAVSGEIGNSSSGKEQIGIVFDLLDFQGQRITYFGSFSDNAFEHTMKAMRTAGWLGDDLSDLSSIGGPSAPEVQLVVANEEYQGKVYTKVKWVNAPHAGVKNALDPSAKAAFAARMKSKIRAFDASSGTRSAPRQASAYQAPEPPPHTDDDLPF